MKIMNLSFADSAGAAYTLAHALNKLPDMRAINVRANNNYIDYPTIAEAKYFSETSVREMVYQSDVVVFHTAVQPFFTGLHLDKERMKGKKLLLYFHGSDARFYGKAILKQADELMGKYEVLASTPDLMQMTDDKQQLILPGALWMPVARSFSEIKRAYGSCGQDHRALAAFKGITRKIMIAHAPTNVERKGSNLFFKIITELIQAFPHIEYQVIQNVTWDQCLRILSRTNVFYDQHLIGSYGLAAVEAAIFKAAVFCRLNTGTMDVMEKESGIRNPFIQWKDEDELRTQSYALVNDPKLQRDFGKLAHDYCIKVHDEKPVTQRFLKILEGMD